VVSKQSAHSSNYPCFW